MISRGLILGGLLIAAILAGLAAAAALEGGLIDEAEVIDELEELIPSPGTHSTAATVETEPVPSNDDAADDPAIWIDPDRPDGSTVIGTDKQGGIAVYDLEGREIQYRPDGRINNVDLREGFHLGSEPVTIVAATNRTTRTVSLYRVDPATRELVKIDLELAEPDLVVGGICLYRTPDGSFGFFVNGSDGEGEQWTLTGNERREVSAERVARFQFESSTEACVVDDETGSAYFAEEGHGIWRLPVEPGSDDQRELVDSTGDGGSLTADVEGLGIARFPAGAPQLIASSQGSDSFVVYRLGDRFEHLYDFEVVDGELDGAEDTDGLDVTTASLGSEFPHGLLVGARRRQR